MTDNIHPDRAASAANEDSNQAPLPRAATRVVPMQRDIHGNPFWESYLTPESYGVRAEARLPPHMPGVIIFVHGVNSEGEWYDVAEQALCEGLNERLGLGGTEFKLKANSYLDRDKASQVSHVRRYNAADPGNSPVIRFYWGYRGPEKTTGRFKIPLRNISGTDFWKRTEQDKGPWFWGGGPFQNGTNNLQQLWSGRGFSRTLFRVINLQLLNTEPERQLQDAPVRDYYPHAAKRLANLIDRIRRQYPHDTITVMSHSQGTMIAMAATALCETRAPDALLVMNSPFTLDDKDTDAATSGDARPTEGARLRTFRNIANRIKADKRALDERLKSLLQVGKTPANEPWRPDITRDDGIPERDNHGRLYVYFSPHDRVMGMTALQSIGWQGLPDALLRELDGTVYQRMLARLTPCGDDPGSKPFGRLPDMKGGPLCNPDDPKEFWDGNRGPFFNAIKLWAVPRPGQSVHINAERVSEPLTGAEMAGFDIHVLHPDVHAMGDRDEKGHFKDPTYPYFESIYEPEQLSKRENIYTGRRELETKEEAQARLSRHRAEPTDHSTLPSNPDFIRRIAAYDLPIGFCESFENRDFWIDLRMEADWTQCTDAYFERDVLLKPAMPPLIDKETIEDAILKAVVEREKRRRYYGG